MLKSWLPALALLAAAGLCRAEDEQAEPKPVKYQITGLFSRDRVEDLRKVGAMLPDVMLVNIDYERAEASFLYDPAKAFKGVKPEEYVKRLDDLVRNASRHTFGVKPVSTVPRDKLKLVEIKVVGLDCKACSLAAYEAIFRIDGVEQATASFHDGLVTALIEEGKTDRAALEDALRKRQVQVLESP
ncbi:MAG TPA: hypothetical protein VHB77_09870 [Planctomycetaceae bacterium]|nr:hypothetical protein [Planctomycetaceae bacterium]